MSTRTQSKAKTASAPTPSFAPLRYGLLERKSAFGSTPGLTGEFLGSRGRPLVSQPPLIQAKLTIGQPNDRYEQEADRVADLLMRMPDPGLQRQVEPEEEEKEETLQAKPLAVQITPLVQRQIEPEEEEEEEEEPIQTKQAGGQTSRPGLSQEAQIHHLRGGGQPLPESMRAFFEPRFGHDLSQVRIHTDAQSAETTRDVRAKAYTVGQDIVFGSGQYAPRTAAGKRLLAHELTHVVQQTRREPGAPNMLQRQVNFDADFTNISPTDGARATIDDGTFTYHDANFTVDANIVATGDRVAELNEWDVGIFQDLVGHWDRYYWRRENTDGRGRFVEQKYLPIRTRFRDQVNGATTVWYADNEHQLLSGLVPMAVGGRFQVSRTIGHEDLPGGPDTVGGSSVPGMDASDGIRNINIQRTGARFDTWISAHNTVTGAWRHLRSLNWNYQRSLDFAGNGAALAVGTETRQLGSHGPYDAGTNAPLIAGTTYNTVLNDNARYSHDRVDGWT